LQHIEKTGPARGNGKPSFPVVPPGRTARKKKGTVKRVGNKKGGVHVRDENKQLRPG